jgi:hypothetical protein
LTFQQIDGSLILDAEFVPGQQQQQQLSASEGPVVKSAFAALLPDAEDDEEEEDDRQVFGAKHKKYSSDLFCSQRHAFSCCCLCRSIPYCSSQHSQGQGTNIDSSYAVHRDLFMRTLLLREY